MRRVVAAHEIPERAALRTVVGETVEVGQRDTEWSAFVFITTERGQGWVPERFLSPDRPSAAVVTAYDTQELAVADGEQIEVLHDDAESGWSWCRNADAVEGWVPTRVLTA